MQNNKKTNKIFSYIKKYKTKSKIKIPTITQKSCNICQSSNFEYFSSGYDYEINTNSNLWVFEKCISCGHVQMNKLPSKQSIELFILLTIILIL